MHRPEKHRSVRSPKIKASRPNKCLQRGKHTSNKNGRSSTPKRKRFELADTIQSGSLYKSKSMQMRQENLNLTETICNQSRGGIMLCRFCKMVRRTQKDQSSLL